jgi:alpha/beta superfamily hydrolase
MGGNEAMGIGLISRFRLQEQRVPVDHRLVDPERVQISVLEAFLLEGEASLRLGQPLAVLCHPHPAFGGHMHNPLLLMLEKRLHAKNVSTVRFNFRGVGGSGGAATGGIEERVDVEEVYGWAKSHAQEVVLIGYSFGALMAAAAVANGIRPQAAVAIALPTSLVVSRPERRQALEEAIACNVPWLFVAGDRDPLCDLAALRDWMADVSTARLEVLEGGGHVFEVDDEQWVCEKVADFAAARSYLSDDRIGTD